MTYYTITHWYGIEYEREYLHTNPTKLKNDHVRYDDTCKNMFRGPCVYDLKGVYPYFHDPVPLEPTSWNILLYFNKRCHQLG